LGNTIDQIAWQKAGIFKKDVPAVTVPQLPEAMDVLNKRAEEKQVRKNVLKNLNFIYFFVSVH
jgi:folylpolyglutamate synthase